MRYLICMFFMVGLIKCRSKPNVEEEKQSILSLLKQEQAAHLKKDVNHFLSAFNPVIISVNRGEVAETSIKENQRQIEQYFNSVEFLKWEDVAPPKIAFSDDGTLAYAIVQKQVILSDVRNKNKNDTTDFAWVSIYRKQKNGWKLECNVSTNK